MKLSWRSGKTFRCGWWCLAKWGAGSADISTVVRRPHLQWVRNRRLHVATVDSKLLYPKIGDSRQGKGLPGVSRSR